MPIYLDCNATTPIDPSVRTAVLLYLEEEYGNAGSRTHEFGNRAKRAVNKAREQVAQVAGAESDEIVFTSGATESNNIAILGLSEFGKRSNKRHVISSEIEHKAVLEPLEQLARDGFDVELVKPSIDGIIDPQEIRSLLRDDTLLVSLMHVNNETAATQPIGEVVEAISGHDAFFHVDAAQGFGKDIPTLRNPRIDLISISGHKLFAPKGVGALITRKRDFERPPLTPLMFGGGQERGLRPGTLPVHLIVGLGMAAEEALRGQEDRRLACLRFREAMLEGLSEIEPKINGRLENLLPNAISLSFSGVDSEALMVALKEEISISNGSACTSSSYTPSHVLTSMGLSPDRVREAVRISWCHSSEIPDWHRIAKMISALR